MMKNSLEQPLEILLNERHQKNLYRSRRVVQSAQGAQIIVDGKKYLAFCSNDYLGLANHPDVIKTFQSAANQYGVGSGASHLVIGHSHEHHALEEELAAFTGRDRALLFSTGYMANLGVITALLSEKDAVFEDKLNHASLIDAGLASGARFQRYLHNDLDNLKTRLEKSDAEKKLIAVDGVFSMDGDCAPLKELVQLAKEKNAWLMVDDAHGFGCLGKNGGGCAEHFGLSHNGLAQSGSTHNGSSQTELPILMGTLGKAFGTFGAFIAGSDLLIETLIQFARTYIYTTALPPAVAAATRTSLKILQAESWRREHLQHLIQHFRAGAQALDLQLMDSFTPIQPIVIGDELKALSIAQALEQKNIFITAIRPPTVPVGSARLRITFTAEHSIEQVDQLLSALQAVKI